MRIRLFDMIALVPACCIFHCLVPSGSATGFQTVHVVNVAASGMVFQPYRICVSYVWPPNSEIEEKEIGLSGKVPHPHPFTAASSFLSF